MSQMWHSYKQVARVRTYYIVESNDGCQASTEQPTINAARQELKEIKQEDRNEGLEDGEIEYYIMKYTETDDTV